MPDLLDQIIDRINKAGNFLIILPTQDGIDSLSSGLALASFLQKLEKEVTVFSEVPVPEKLEFLPQKERVVNTLNLIKSFVIDVATNKTQLEELSYKKEDNRLSIFLEPKSGEFNPSDISFRSSNFTYDQIITLGVPNLESIGNFYGQHADLFFETPVINIDYSARNENYAQYNLINLNASSVAEVVMDLLNRFEQNLIDQPIATSLLAGIIAETNSFQHTRTSPQTFLKASELIGLGADQQEIIKHLFKTKSLTMLKLWGRALARLEQRAGGNLVYTTISFSDMQKSQAKDEEVAPLIKEMSSQLSFAKIFLLFKEEVNNQTKVFAQTTTPINLNLLLSSYQPKIGAFGLEFEVNSALPEAATQITKLVESELLKLNF